MARQAADTSGSRSSITPSKAVASALAGLNFYRSEPQEPGLSSCWRGKSRSNFSCCHDSYKFYSLSEMTHAERGERVVALKSGFSEEAANKNVIKILFFSIGQTVRKILFDKFPATQIAGVPFLFFF